MLKIENITKKFGKHLVLDSLSLDLPTARIHGIVGLNGSGKTTLFNILSGTENATSGIFSLSSQPLRMQDIAYLETDNYFYPMLTAQEHLNLFKQTNKNYNEQALLQLFHLPSKQLIEEFSTGMKKKLALIALLKQDKKLYILDEPFNGIDLEGSILFEKVLTQLKDQGKTILISSHILESLEKTADTISLLSGGKISKTFFPNEFNAIHILLGQELTSKMNDERLF